MPIYNIQEYADLDNKPMALVTLDFSNYDNRILLLKEEELYLLNCNIGAFLNGEPSSTGINAFMQGSPQFTTIFCCQQIPDIKTPSFFGFDLTEYLLPQMELKNDYRYTKQGFTDYTYISHVYINPLLITSVKDVTENLHPEIPLTRVNMTGGSVVVKYNYISFLSLLPIS